MMLDDVYGGDVEEDLVTQDVMWRERVLPELEWDETETSFVIDDLLGESPARRYAQS